LAKEYPNVDYRALKLDLSSQEAVREAAAEVLGWEDIPIIDILVNSAGVMLVPERTLSKDGIEMHFATNHIGHYLFTNLILPKLVKAAKGSRKGATRVINVSSSSPVSAGIRWSDINFDKINKTLPENEQPNYTMLKSWGAVDPEEKSYFPREGYNQSKVANLLFSIGANNRLYKKYGILSLAVNPGVIMTELSRYSPPEVVAKIQNWAKSGQVHMKTQGAGASTTLVAATDPALGLPEVKNGKENYGAYLVDCQISDQANPRAVSSDNADRLWKLSEELVNQKFSEE
jgi:NAD(P)-dependent dehydrogenase (short-subunit alcohol dehydrogenase family)